MGMRKLAMTVAVLSIAAFPAGAMSAEMGSGGMHGQGMMDGKGMHGQGMADGKAMHGGHDMMKMGTRAWQGRIGPWNGEARVMDMKAAMKSAGMAPQEGMMNTHHVSVSITDPKSKQRVTEGSGTVSVIAPDKSVKTYPMTAMQGHFGADVALGAPGAYRFKVNIESGGKTGIENFMYKVE